MKRLLPLALLIFLAVPAAAQTRVAFDSDIPQTRFAIDKLEQAIPDGIERISLQAMLNGSEEADVVVLTSLDDAVGLASRGYPLTLEMSMPPESYRIIPVDRPHQVVVILAVDPSGAMYGVLDLAEQLRMGKRLEDVELKAETPRISLRAVKFNLPWSPYRPEQPTELHLSVARDPAFWARFLDMMAENRLNALTLWNMHPFPYMIRAENFPEATPFSDTELAEWKAFWKALFRMAKDRGIETYIVNWNIVVSPEMAVAYGVDELNDTSEVVRRYARESITQTINEYEDLTGIGVTLADWMNDMTPRAREDWVEETFVAGIKAADRPVKFIHRSVLAGSPNEMRRVIDNADLPDPVWVEIKFNWSHAHSTPRLAMTHDYESGNVDDAFWNPEPTNYKIAWMMRNEDFFVLRWGEPGFIRDHIVANDFSYVDGYFIGSEGYIPALDYVHEVHPHKTWQYAFERQWLFYKLWGRLLYNPDTPDEVFAAELDQRYRPGIGQDLLQAYTLASRMPLRLASFHAATWDFTLYSEGFLAPAISRGIADTVSSFINILEFIDHQVLDPTFISIPDYVASQAERRAIPADRTTPLELADASEQDARRALALVDRLRPSTTPFTGALECELSDVQAWSHLGLYLAEKLRAGVALETFRRTGNEPLRATAIRHLEQSAEHWDNVIKATSYHYRPHMYPAMDLPVVGYREGRDGIFSWELLREQVLRDVVIARTVRSQP